MPSTPPSTNRNRNSTPPSSVLPNSPGIKLPNLSGNSEQFKRIVLRVQMMLFAYGFYTGEIDGVAGNDTKLAIAKYQIETVCQSRG